MASKSSKKAIWEGKIVGRAIVDSFVKLDPRHMMGNPVMFVVEVGSVITTVLLVRGGGAFLVQSADHAVAVVHRVVRQLRRSHGRRPRQGASRHVAQGALGDHGQPRCWRTAQIEKIPSSKLRAGEWCVVFAGEFVPSDGEIIEGVASVDESAITGESAPVIREAGGDRSAVTGGTRVLSDQIKVKVTSNPGETFLDRMIALVEGAERQKTPNEIALNILLAGLTIIFLLAVVTLQPFAIYSRRAADGVRAGLVAGVPDSHDHRRLAFGHRHRRHGPPDPAQRAGHVGPRGGSCGRRGHTAARQDRNHHPGQSPGVGVHSRSRRERKRNGRRGAALVAGGRDARRPLDCRAGEREIRPARAGTELARNGIRSLHRADAHVGRQHERQPDSQGRRRCHHQVSGREWQRDAARSASQLSSRLRTPAARRWWWRKRDERWA